MFQSSELTMCFSFWTKAWHSDSTEVCGVKFHPGSPSSGFVKGTKVKYHHTKLTGLRSSLRLNVSVAYPALMLGKTMTKLQSLPWPWLKSWNKNLLWCVALSSLSNLILFLNLPFYFLLQKEHAGLVYTKKFCLHKLWCFQKFSHIHVYVWCNPKELSFVLAE